MTNRRNDGAKALTIVDTVDALLFKLILFNYNCFKMENQATMKDYVVYHIEAGNNVYNENLAKQAPRTPSTITTRAF